MTVVTDNDSLSQWQQQRGMNGYNTVWDLRVNMPRLSFHDVMTAVLYQHGFFDMLDRGLESARPVDVPPSIYPLLL
jgi:hypothetical protein